MGTAKLADISVLCIDDEVFTRKLIERMLNDAGARRIAMAGDGREGLEQLAHHADVDVVLLDLDMPKMNGLHFIKVLRDNKAEKLRTMPIVVLSGHSDKELVEKAVKLGIQGYLVKPVALDRLVITLAQSIDAPPLDASD